MKKVDKKLYIPKYPKIIIEELEKNGFEAYIVGGCVRDELMGVSPSDFDITTNAKPDDVKKIFKRTIDTGIKHGTVSVLFYENNIPNLFEVTTFRIEGEYSDGRHPNEVKFVRELIEDLRRRDFTVNAMAYNEEKGLIDEFNGIQDLHDRIIRAVGNPTERFNEDALRLLRAIRFSAKLGFDIEEKTKDAIPILASNLLKISKERIQIELVKTITSDNPTYVDKIFELELAKYIAEDFEKIKIGKFEKHLEKHIAISCLFYNNDTELSRKILRELKFDNDTISKVISLLNSKKKYFEIRNLYSDYVKNKNYNKTLALEVSVKELIDEIGYSLVYDFLNLVRINEGDKDIIKNIVKMVEKFEREKIPIFIKDLAINGTELLNIGFKGEEIGHILANFKAFIHKKPTFNEKKLLQDMAKKVYNIYVKGISKK